MATLGSEGMAANSVWSRNRKVRVVAKIREFTESEISSGASLPWIQVKKPNGDASESVTISFGEQAVGRKENFELDYCYEQNHESELIFSREIKYLISGIFDGRDATVITVGATGSGKTGLIQGINEKPGLAPLAMAEILSLAEGRESSVYLSLYEVYQGQVYDVIDSERRLISVLEDAQRKIHLKGLSQIPLKCMSDFQKFFSTCGSRKSGKKMPTEFYKSHRGLMVHVLSHGKNSDAHLIGRMNIVELAGYEDVRRKSSDGPNFVKNSNINKSLYALHNVINALNCNETRVPYRESKLTHLLQDSLGGMSRILMIVCLNPSFCQDSVHMISLATRSCQGSNRAAYSTKKTKSSARPMVPSSHKNRITSGSSTAVKKSNGLQVQFSERKGNSSVFAMKGRKLFGEPSQLTKAEKESSSSAISLSMAPSLEDEEMPKSIAAELKVSTIESLVKAEDVPLVGSEKNSITLTSNENEPIRINENVSLHGENNPKQVAPATSDSKILLSSEEDHKIDKENDSSVVIKSQSPPLSARLRELSNNLKLLHSSTALSLQRPVPSKTQISTTPVNIQIPEASDFTDNTHLSTDLVEPRTPEITMGINDTSDVPNTNSPWARFNIHSSGMKDTLVHEYLRFLNSANKEDLKKLKGIGEKRATYILQLREQSPEPFKSLDDLQEIGLSGKQIKGMMKKEVGEIFK